MFQSLVPLLAGAGARIAGETLWRGLSVSSKGFAIAGAALNAALLPLDVYQLIDVVHQQGKQKYDYEDAAQVGELIIQLEEQRDELKDFLYQELRMSTLRFFAS